jgi:hypothetical protein
MRKYITIPSDKLGWEKGDLLYKNNTKKLKD